MDDDRRQVTSGSETKDFITHVTASSMSMSMIVSVLLAYESHKSDSCRPRSMLAHIVDCITERNPELWVLKSFIIDSMLALFSKERHYLYLPKLFAIQKIFAKIS